MLQSLDGAAVRRWAVTCCDTLAAHRDEIDALNVFPVPDQDTGSNLLATMRAGLDAVLQNHRDDRDAAPGNTVAMLARGALMGARGNSGVILSQVLRGLAEPLITAQARAWDGAALRAGLCRADELALAAVSEPVPGTVLTVLHAAAQAAAAVRCDDLGEVASAATAAAAGALADTPRQLAALATAGVVDAGGRGLTLLLEALLAVVSERPGARSAADAHIRSSASQAVHAECGSTAYEYEVMYLLEGAADAEVIRLRSELATLGDCVAVVGTGPTCDGPPAGSAGNRTTAGRAGNRTTALWNVHVHCSDIDAAIDAGRRAGRPHRITVMRFADQVLERAAARDRYRTDHAVLVLAGATGVAQLCRREGAVVAPATSSVADLLEACAATHARHVTVLVEPSATTAAEAAAAQAGGTGQDVVVVVAGSAVQVLAAVAVHDAARRPAEDRAAMTDAVSATRYAELTTRDGLGGFVGILDGQVVVINCDLLAATRELVARLLAAGGELLTVLLGQEAPTGFAAVLTEQLRAAHPKVEMMCYAGDVPQRVLLVGVE